MQVAAVRSVVLAMLNPGEGVSPEEEIHQSGKPPVVVPFDPNRRSDFSRADFVKDEPAARHGIPEGDLDAPGPEGGA